MAEEDWVSRLSKETDDHNNPCRWDPEVVPGVFHKTNPLVTCCCPIAGPERVLEEKQSTKSGRRCLDKGRLGWAFQFKRCFSVSVKRLPYINFVWIQLLYVV